MGCFNSKHSAPSSSFPSSSPPRRRTAVISRSFKDPPAHHRVAYPPSINEDHGYQKNVRKHSGAINVASPNGKMSGVSVKSGLSHGNLEAELVAAGWPSWLSSAAPEAIRGLVPLKPDAFEKLEKIGQGTYSSVFKACEVETGRRVALKKVRLENLQNESIRFMAREIVILRRLDHPNIMKLEGIITSRSSNSLYLVFEYMEHDLAGLSSSPDIIFTESQIKCYMKQLLLALEHCHMRGIMHRDIKTSNILVNNRGILKLADFGLANVISPRNKNRLTSRVVTLWYRAPELLMGSTSYGVSVDLWSVGCVFAEILSGMPVLKGRTEIEQLHKIYKLCGTPSEDFWERTRISQTTMYRPQSSYEGSLQERFHEFPETAVNLVETFLSIEPDKRGTASSALFSEYFNTKPHACDPSSLPKYPPNKEMDAKHREDLRRKKASIKFRVSASSKRPRKALKPVKDPREFNNLPQKQETQVHAKVTRENKDAGIARTLTRQISVDDTPSKTSQATTTTQGDFLYTSLSHGTAPASGLAWGRRRKEPDMVSTLTANNPPGAGSQVSGASIMFVRNTLGLPTTREGKDYWR